MYINKKLHMSIIKGAVEDASLYTQRRNYYYTKKAIRLYNTLQELWKSYIAKTSKKIETWLREHKNAIKNMTC